MTILYAIIFFGIGLLLLAAMTWEGYAILTKHRTISRWMADRIKDAAWAFTIIMGFALVVWVVLLLHFTNHISFWSP